MATKNLGISSSSPADQKRAAWRYLGDYCRPAKDFGFDDEKRLQARFSDRALKLKWNMKNRQCEIWYVKEQELPYCILTIKDRYNYPKAEKELIQRERSSKEVAEEYLKHQEEADRDQARQMKDYTRPYAEAAWSKAVGKTSIIVP